MNDDLIAKGFGKGIHDYLSTSVALADAKAAAFLAAAATVGVGVLQVSAATSPVSILRAMSLSALAASAGVHAFVILPRLPSGRRGLIFWEDIRSRPRLEDYVREATKLTALDVELEYAAQNYFVSDVLHRKHWWIRRGIGLFVLGGACGVAAYLLT